MGGMLDYRHIHAKRVGGRCDHDDCIGVREIIWTWEDFDSRERTKKTDRRAISRYTALGACLKWRDSKSREENLKKMIWCLETAMTRLANIEKRVEKRSGAQRGPCTSLVKEEQKKAVLWRFVSWPVCTSHPSSILFFT